MSTESRNCVPETPSEAVADERLVAAPELLALGTRKSPRLRENLTFCKKKHDAKLLKELKYVLRKPEEDWNAEERAQVAQNPALLNEAKKRMRHHQSAVARRQELEDPKIELIAKCEELATIMKNSKHLVVYTGAGISTAANIPDYRGPNGIWTKLRNGVDLDTDKALLTSADPTITHMAIYKLFDEGLVKHAVSQNCDGLHLRSGLPKVALSEVHGNMYIEVCTKCDRQYVRLFDVTENTRKRLHRTGRHCYGCGSPLKDTIVHFGERGSLQWPLNWSGAQENASKADVILCLGSSLKVLRRYPWLWCMDQPSHRRPIICIVNLQWTPKDKFAKLKINGRCDEVMGNVMQKLNFEIPKYHKNEDPLLSMATPLHPMESSIKNVAELAFLAEDSLKESSCHDGHCTYATYKPDLRPSVVETLANQAKRKRVINGTGWFGNAWGGRKKSRKKVSKETLKLD